MFFIKVGTVALGLVVVREAVAIEAPNAAAAAAAVGGSRGESFCDCVIAATFGGCTVEGVPDTTTGSNESAAATESVDTRATPLLGRYC